MKLLLKALRAPRTIVRIVADRFVAPRWLRLRGVEVGAGCRFNGAPLVKIAAGSRIALGARVLVNSRTDSNAATQPHQAMLSTLAPEAEIRIGEDAGLSGASLVAATRIEIGPRTMIGSGACIWDTDFHPLDPAMRRRHPSRGAMSAPICIGSDVFVGARALILKGVTIGDEAIVGAGSVVTRDVSARSVVAGNPARVVSTVDQIVARGDSCVAGRGDGR